MFEQLAVARNMTNMQKKTVVLILVLIVFCLSIVSLNLYAAENTQEEEAWRVLQPDIRVLWTMETGGEVLHSSRLWDLIYDLKRFIQVYHDSSHVPEAYFLLGLAYSRAGYSPEAEAHWMITAKYYPETNWAGDALSMLAKHLQESGNAKKLERYYIELVENFPNSNAALSMKSVMAIEALEKGRLDIAEAVVKDIEKKVKDVEINVPKFLDLKARLAAAKGNLEEARLLWIHYLNLIKTPEIRADILYRIAETYRKSGEPLKARKYFALIKRDFPSTMEAKFASFRMSEIEERARQSMEGFVSGLGQKNLQVVDQLYTDIIKKYPDHPVTKEVMAELIQVKMDENKFLEALQLAETFGVKHPESKLINKVTDMALESSKFLIADANSIEKANRVVSWARDFINKKGLNEIQKIVAKAGDKVWQNLISMLYENKMFYETLEEFSQYRAVAGEEDDGVKKSQKLVAGSASRLSQELVEEEKFMELLNYYYKNRKLLDNLIAPGFQLDVGKAWKSIGDPSAAMKAFYREFHQYGTSSTGLNALLELADSAVSEGRLGEAKNAVLLYDMAMKDVYQSPAAYLVKAKTAFKSGDWASAFNLAKETLADNGNESRGAEIAYEASVKLGRWDYVKKIWERFSPVFSDKEDKLRLWGDAALELIEPDIALDAYNRLIEIDPENSATKWKIAKAKALKGDSKGSFEVLDTLSTSKDGIWSEVARADKLFDEFMQGPAGEL